MRQVELLNALHLDDQLPFDQKVEAVGAIEHNRLATQGDRFLALEKQLGRRKLVSKAFGVG